MAAPPRLQRTVAALLRPFTKVRPEETATVVVMTFAAFLLLCGYYLLKTVREPLILMNGGAEMKLYLRAAQAVAMVGIVHLYGQLARRFGRMKLLSFVFVFFISNLVVFAVLAGTSVPIALPFFLWVGVFAYTSVAQFWALAADIHTEEQGKRLFPIIGAGSSIGAVVGGLVAGSLARFGTQLLMEVSIAFLVAFVALVFWIERRAVTSATESAPPVEEPTSRESPWRLLARDRYLLVIAGMVVCLNWVNSSGEYLLDRTVLVAAQSAASPGRYIAEFKADYFFWYNAIGLSLQLLVVSRAFKLVGVRGALFVMPVFALGAYGAAAALPVLATVRLVKIGENSMQYSLQDTTRNALFLVTSRPEKFVGKTATDTIAVRLGAIMSTIIVFIGAEQQWALGTFATINVTLAGAWLVFVLLIFKEHARRSAEGPDAIAAEPLPLVGG